VSWPRGREEILAMLDKEELTQVVADLELAQRLLAAARRHVNSAETLGESDPELAYAALYDAIRKALSAMLQAQGLRPTSDGGHLAVQRAIHAQFGASMGALLRPVNRIRTTRHAVQYPDAETYIDADQIRADLPAAVELVEAAEKAVPHLPVFTR
jgi:uncharacterized protein (UPF0332 family)